MSGPGEEVNWKAVFAGVRAVVAGTWVAVLEDWSASADDFRNPGPGLKPLFPPFAKLAKGGHP